MTLQQAIKNFNTELIKEHLKAREFVEQNKEAIWRKDADLLKKHRMIIREIK